MQLVLSLFPGIGLLDRAFELEGNCVLRGPDVLWGGDIREFHPPSGKFDGVIGGPPCQAFSSLVHLVRTNGYEPKFGNLIPEFERCIVESKPAWFLMEEVRGAPVPVVEGYGIKDFLFNNAWIPGDDAIGQEQERLRRFSFGLRGKPAVDLRKFIEPAALLRPESAGTLTQWMPNNEPEAKQRRGAVVGDLRETPVAIGGSGKPKRKRAMFGDGRPTRKEHRQAAVTGNVGGMRRRHRYTFADACRLQGLPEDFLEHAPFTATGKLQVVANGVPIPLGRAIARAVKEAISNNNQE